MIGEPKSSRRVEHNIIGTLKRLSIDLGIKNFNFSSVHINSFDPTGRVVLGY